ncbi:MAG: MCP four helix bundle domain-containing protein, partial [Bosea sp. (in: a-proteobacteria)]
MTIKTKLAGAFGVIIALAMSAGGLAYIKLNEATETQGVLVDWSNRIDKFGDLQTSLNGAIRSEKTAVMVTDEAEMAKRTATANERRAKAAKTAAELAASASPEARKLWQQFDPLFAEFSTLQQEALRNTNLNSGARAAEIWTKETMALAAMITKTADPVIAELTRDGASVIQMRGALALQQVRLDWLRLTRTAANLFSAATMADLEKASAKLTEDMRVLSTVLEARLRPLADAGVSPAPLIKLYGEAIASLTKVVRMASEGGNIKAIELTSGRGMNVVTAMMQRLGALTDLIKKASAQAATEAVAQAELAKTLLLAILAASLLIATSAAFWIALNISRGLSSAVGLANAVAIGDLSHSIQVKNDDEIGDLVKALNTMTDNLNATAA